MLVAVIRAPSRSEETWRPTTQKERISIFLEEREEPASQRQIFDAAKGKRDYKIQAVAALVADRYVATADGPRGATYYSSVKPYRRRRSDRSPPYRGNGRGERSAPGQPEPPFPSVDGAPCRGRTLGLEPCACSQNAA